MKKNQEEILQALNPADYFTLAMDQEIRDETGVGSLCGCAVELKSLPSISLLTARIDELSQKIPLILSSLQQRGQRFYWCQRKKKPTIFFNSTCVEISVHHRLEALMNQVQPREDTLPLSFHLLVSQHKIVLLLRWLHPLCDAVGANLILQFLCTDQPEQRQLFDSPKTSSLVTLRLKKFSLWKKIHLFFQAKRYITALDQQQSIIHTRTKSPQKLCLLSFRLSTEQTKIIKQMAQKTVGIMGTSLYYIGCFMRALDKMNPREQTGEAYCVPYAFNLRQQKALTPLLGNHVGVLFAQAPKKIVNHRKQLFEHLTQQNKQVIRKQLDDAFLPVMWAASFLSLKQHGKNLRQSYQHQSERSSFWFSHIGLFGVRQQTLCHSEIKGMTHFCQLSSPPGIGLLSSEYQQQLTLNYNYITPLFDEDWIERLHTLMMDELLH